MLKKLTVVCGLLLAATTVMAWDTLPPVPTHVDVDTGCHLIWGDTLLWGLFPTDGGGTGRTYLASFNPRADDTIAWDTLRISGVKLHRTGIAFQWVERPVVWFTGKDNPGISRLYHYDVRTATTTQETLTRFTLDMGASIAYVPNEGFNPYWNPTPGYLYFLPGGDSTFWRRSITARDLPDPQIYGYEYPADEVAVSDPTPTFRWTPWESEQYRLEISTNLNFTSNVIDTVVPTAEWQSSAELDSGSYYWRVSTWVEGSGGGYWDPVEIFPRQVWVYPCWAQLLGLDHDPWSGAKLAYCDDSAFGHKSVVAMYGDYLRRFAEYDIDNGTWDSLCNAPWDVDNASSLTTNAAVGGNYRIYAAFSHDDEGDCPSRYLVDSDDWDVINDESAEPIYNTHFTDNITWGSSMAIGAEDMLYLLPGHIEDFYVVSLERFPGGQQARVVPSGRAKAQAVTVRDGVEVEYQLPAAAYVRASLHDALGRHLGTLDAGKQNAGTHRLSWNRNQEGRKLSAGAYFVSLDLGAEQVNLKTVVP
jgi:hypothetical protein